MASVKTTDKAAKQARLCEKCAKNPVAFSERTKRHIKLCAPCNAVKREANNQSYHNRHQRQANEERMQEKLSERKEQVDKVKRECAAIKEQLASLNIRYKAMEQAYEAAQRSLADALDAVNTGAPREGVQLPSSISVRTESIVVQRLQELTELVTTWNERGHSEIASALAKLHEEREEAKAQTADLVSELERLISKLVVRASAKAQA